LIKSQTALDGIRVVDVTRYIPGPYATMLLGDLGADVVKIEEPPIGDPTRAVRPVAGDDSAVHASLNRNKRSVLVDLRHEAGAGLVRTLASQADVFVEGFRPGTLARRGLGPDELLRANPRLVYCSVSGYGQDSPLSSRAGHDVNYLARGGLLEGAATPSRPAVAQIADMTGGLLALAGILSALLARERTGRGQHVDVSLLRGALGLMTVPLARLEAGGEADAELTGSYACYNVYRCRDSRALSVGALEPKFWEALCRALGHEDRIPRQWEKEPGRGETLALFARTFASRKRDEWVSALNDVECCVEPVLEPQEALAEAQAQGALVSQPSGAAMLRVVGAPFGLRDTPALLRRPAPKAGEHTDEILREAGYPAEAIARLHESGAVA
jgi:crotonobetainyl-CoA:carnitine CoA-transferase CaiB-like acyl-CoA transferase